MIVLDVKDEEIVLRGSLNNLCLMAVFTFRTHASLKDRIRMRQNANAVTIVLLIMIASGKFNQ